MNLRIKFNLVVILSLLFLLNLGLKHVLAQSTNDWPMAGADPSRSSWTPQTLPGNIKAEWVKPVTPYVSQHVQVIGAENKVFLSTAAGLYAFDANTGTEVWIYPTELPLGHSPTYSDGFLYVGGMDRKMHKVNAGSGSGVWTFDAEGGFYTNPVVVNNRVYAGNRDGAFYAIDTDSGSLVWKYQTGNQILQSAAYSDNTLYFASNDGYTYALNATDGALIWKSQEKLPSMGQYSWWPVVYQNYVIYTRTPFEGGLTGEESKWAFCPPGVTTCSPGQNKIPGVFANANDEISNQPTMDIRTNPNGSTLPNYFETFPHRRNAYFFNRTTGQEVTFDLDADGTTDAAPISWVGDAGSRHPPIVSGFDNVLYFRTLNRTQGASFSSASLAGWNVGTPFMSLPFSSVSQQSGGMPQDEPVGLSAGGNKIYWNLCCDRFVGAVDLSQRNTNFFSSVDDGNRQWRYIASPGLPFYTPPTNIGIPTNYYLEATKFFNDPPNPAIFWNENDKPGPAVYNNRLYVILGNALVSFAQGGAGSNAPILQSAPFTAPVQNMETLSDSNLRYRLEQEVSEILIAGHLKPSYSTHGGITQNLKSAYDDYGSHLWHNPSDTQVTLLRALPYLTENLQQQVRIYLQTEMANFSPATYTHIGWVTGTQRDPYPYPPTDPKLFTISSGPLIGVNFSGWSFPPHNIYAVWKYAQAGLGDPITLFNQVKTKLKAPITLNKAGLTNTYLAGYPHVHNAYIAGYIGYIELAKLANQPESVYLPYQQELDRLLELRVANLTLFPNPLPPQVARDHDYFETMITAWNFMYLTPELGNYLKTNAETSVLSIIESYQNMSPYWMVAHHGETQGENAIMPYQQTHSLFQALSLVKDAPREELSKYLDAPIIPVGDLYYIDNLVSALESPAIPPPDPYIGDADNNGVVDENDYSVWLINYNTTTSAGSSVGDFNGDTKVDGQDYVIWFNTLTIQ